MNHYMLYMVAHKLSGLAIVVGIVLFIVWAAKNLKGPQLKKVATWLVVLGLIVGIATGVCGKKKMGMRSHTALVEQLNERGYAVTEEEMSEVMKAVHATKKKNWHGKWSDNDEDDDNDETEQ